MLRNIPNCLSVIRICLIPVFVYVYFSVDPNRFSVALIIFVISGLTDLLDGYLARQFNWITPLGTALDPLADKLMMIAVLTCLVIDRRVPLFVLVIILIKEVSMILVALYIYFSQEKTVVPANKMGKTAAALFFLALVLVLLDVPQIIGIGMLITAVLMKLVAFIGYARYYLKTIRHL